MPTIDEKVGLKHEVNFDADPNLNAIKIEMKKLQDMCNLMKASLNDAVANAGVVSIPITTENIDL